MLQFEDWLFAQQEREDPIGDLARAPGLQEVEHKLSKHKFDEHKKWTEIVIKLDEPGYVYIFNTAWQEFLTAKRAAGASQG
jgi:hypothetical protein